MSIRSSPIFLLGPLFPVLLKCSISSGVGASGTGALLLVLPNIKSVCRRTSACKFRKRRNEHRTGSYPQLAIYLRPCTRSRRAGRTNRFIATRFLVLAMSLNPFQRTLENLSETCVLRCTLLEHLLRQRPQSLRSSSVPTSRFVTMAFTRRLFSRPASSLCESEDPLPEELSDPSPAN
jgi:hypothetical protein